MLSLSYTYFSSSESGLHPWVSTQHSLVPSYCADSPHSPTSAGKYRWTRSRVVLGVLIQYASVVIFAAWSLYLWANVKDYGSQPECNDQIKYVLFFVTVRATAPWLRDLWITALALGAVGLMVWFGVKAVKLFVNNHVEEAEEAIQMKSIAGKETPTETPETPLPGETEQSKKSWYFHVSRSIPFVLSVL
jgi:hypothetical protein